MLVELNSTHNRVANTYTFTEEDRLTLSSYDGIIEGIATLFGNQCDVHIQSLEGIDDVSEKNAHIFKSGSKVNAPTSEHAFNMLQDIFTQQMHCSKAYFSRTKDGKMLRSMSIAINNISGRTIGVMAINLDIGASFINFVQELLPPVNTVQLPPPEDKFSRSIEHIVEQTIEKTFFEINHRTDISNSAKNKHVVISLHQQGIFDIKDAINMVATKLNISKHTVYLYIRQLKTCHV